MAGKDDESKSRSRRNPTRPRTPSSAQSLRNLSPAVENIIEEERGHLMSALALLDSALLVLEAADEDGYGATEGPHCPTLIEIARDTVKRSINRLDSINLIRAANALRVREPYVPLSGAKESGESGALWMGDRLTH